VSSNKSASIRARLLNRAKDQGVPFDDVLRRYGIERFLYRLACSEYKDRFILKGAQLLRVWATDPFRPTMDLDLLGRIQNSPDGLKELVQQICRMEVEPGDCLRFDDDRVDAVIIKEDADYHGVQLTFAAYLGTARIPLQIDIGFNDVVFPRPYEVDVPSLLDLPGPRLYGYTPESVFAEKYEAMVKLGELNSRMKDFYDLRFLINSGLLASQELLVQAIKETFARRKTEIPASLPVLLLEDHPALGQKQVQWAAFTRKKRLKDAPADFTAVTLELREFIVPLLEQL
jgi:hypothetical protein